MTILVFHANTFAISSRLLRTWMQQILPFRNVSRRAWNRLTVTTFYIVISLLWTDQLFLINEIVLYFKLLVMWTTPSGFSKIQTIRNIFIRGFPKWKQKIFKMLHPESEPLGFSLTFSPFWFNLDLGDWVRIIRESLHKDLRVSESQYQVSSERGPSD